MLRRASACRRTCRFRAAKSAPIALLATVLGGAPCATAAAAAAAAAAAGAGAGAGSVAVEDDVRLTLLLLLTGMAAPFGATAGTLGAGALPAPRRLKPLSSQMVPVGKPLLPYRTDKSLHSAAQRVN